MMPRPAQYLLRFDDLCPTIEPVRWKQCVKLIEEFDIRPILAIVPENRDPDLENSPVDPGFWYRLCNLESAGATTAVHGYRHLCHSGGKSILKLHTQTEFAGVDFTTQKDWIREGFRIVAEKGLHPRLWVAPRHGFDENTLRALRSEGVEYVSDGFARVPHRWRGLTWIPQQLWEPVAKTEGLWTICIHPSTLEPSAFEGLRHFLRNHRDQITSFDRVIREFDFKHLELWERIYERVALARVQRRYRRRNR
jgi:predicted deacetylase